jgi:hypothetical protein
MSQTLPTSVSSLGFGDETLVGRGEWASSALDRGNDMQSVEGCADVVDSDAPRAR